MDDAPHHDPEDELPDPRSEQAPGKRQREWWEWVLIVVGILVLALGGLCVVMIISLNQMY